MTVYGPHAAGFRRKPVSAILDDVRASQWAEIAATLDLSTATPMGQNNGIIANELGIAWEILEICYHAFDPDAAQDFLLTSLSKLTGTLRRGDSYSRVPLTCTLDAGTTLLAGVHYAAVDGDSTSLWTPQEDFTAPSADDYEIVFRAENPGPVAAQPNTITVINTAVMGWGAVLNDDVSAELGRGVDTDEVLRQRREAQLAASGTTTVDAVRADVLVIEDVESCIVFENTTDGVVDGMSPHSIEVIVFDGETPAVENNVIAQAIWDAKAHGIETIGSSSGTAKDVDGADQLVRFTRPVATPLYVVIDIEIGSAEKYTAAGGDEGLAAYLVARFKEMHGPGTDVRWRRLDSLAYDFGESGAVEDVTDFAIGTSPTPIAENLIVNPRLIVTFDVARTTVSST